MRFRHVPNAVRRTQEAGCHWRTAGKALPAVESESEDRPGDGTGLPGQAAATFPQGTQGSVMNSRTASCSISFPAPSAKRSIAPFFKPPRRARGQFLPDPIPDDVLTWVLLAAHHAPSVGFMQPGIFSWCAPRRSSAGSMTCSRPPTPKPPRCSPASGGNLQPPEARRHSRIAPQHLCHLRPGAHRPGRDRAHHMKTMDLYSSVCAVQNLWLAARAEGLGWAG